MAGAALQPFEVGGNAMLDHATIGRVAIRTGFSGLLPICQAGHAMAISALQPRFGMDIGPHQQVMLPLGAGSSLIAFAVFPRRPPLVIPADISALVAAQAGFTARNPQIVP